jgi:hypothetical protein
MWLRYKDTSSLQTQTSQGQVTGQKLRQKHRSRQVTGEDYRPNLTWFKGQVGGAQKLLATILKQHVFVRVHVFSHT